MQNKTRLAATRTGKRRIHFCQQIKTISDVYNLFMILILLNAFRCWSIPETRSRKKMTPFRSLYDIYYLINDATLAIWAPRGKNTNNGQCIGRWGFCNHWNTELREKRIWSPSLVIYRSLWVRTRSNQRAWANFLLPLSRILKNVTLS